MSLVALEVQASAMLLLKSRLTRCRWPSVV